MRMTIKFMLRATVVFAFASAFSPLVLGQSKEYEGAMRSEQDRRAAEHERRLSSWELKMAEVRRPPERRRDPNLAWTQIREDYKQIQIVNNDLARSVSKGGTLDFEYVAKSMSEVRKRAARLKENLALPEPPKSVERSKAEARTEADPLKTSLSVLDKLIIEFVNNPIFDHAKTVDVQMATKASLDLEKIIELSDHLRKSSEKLKKTARTTQ